MKEIPADFDPQAYGRGCMLQQCEMLTRLAEIGMQLAETAGARALAAQAAEAPGAQAEAQPAEAQPRAAAPDPGLAFARYAHLVRQTLAQRARAVQDLCARDGGRDARRARHREEVEDVVIRLIGAGPDRARFADIRMQLDQALVELYGDRDDPVEDRTVPSVVAGLVCGLGLVRQWRRYQPRYETGRPGLPAGSPDEIRAERASRRAAVVAMVEECIAEVGDPARIADLEAGLAARLQEPDVDTLLDTAGTEKATVRLCRSLGIDLVSDLCLENGPEALLDSS